MFQQQQALMNAAAQGAYISPVTLANGQLSQVNGLSNGSVTPTTGKYSGTFAFLNERRELFQELFILHYYSHHCFDFFN